VKIPNIYVYSILAIGIIFSVPMLLNNIQAQMTDIVDQASTNATNATNSTLQNQTAQTAGAAQNQTAQTAGAAQNQTAQTAGAAQNQTAQTAGAAQNQTMSQDTQVLMTLGIPELKENLMDAKESLADGEIEEALTGITDVENQFLLLQNKTKLTGDFQKIKESVSQRDIAKALDDITKAQNEIIKAETEVFKAQLSNPELITGQDDEENGDGN
jgi:hypothetical protein